MSRTRAEEISIQALSPELCASRTAFCSVSNWAWVMGAEAGACAVAKIGSPMAAEKRSSLIRLQDMRRNPGDKLDLD